MRSHVSPQSAATHRQRLDTSLPLIGGASRMGSPFTPVAHVSDTLRFSAHSKKSSVTNALEKDALEKNGGWREQFAQWRQKKILQLRSDWEKHYTAFRKGAVKAMMGIAAVFSCLPLPDFIRGMIERRYFFSPWRVSSSHRLKSQALYQKIDGRRFHPEGNNTYELDSWYIPAQDNQPTVVFSHGRDCNISHLEPILKALSNKGYGVFAYDYPGFGCSEGTPTEEALYEAGVAACKYLAGDGSASTTVPYNKQILMGHSLGGAVAVDIAKKFAEDANIQDPAQRTFNRQDKPELRGQPQALVLANTFTNIQDTCASQKQGFHWVLQRLFDENKIRLKFDSKHKMQDVSMPVLIVHGDKDNDIPPHIGADLFNNIRRAPQGRFHLLPNAHHKLEDDMCRQITDNLTHFLKDLPRQDVSAVS
jgi:alpha-beta hydrolase superfamily lysophospholipase